MRSEPTPEAYEAARQAADAVVRAVWPLAVAEGRRQARYAGIDLLDSILAAAEPRENT